MRHHALKNAIKITALTLATNAGATDLIGMDLSAPTKSWVIDLTEQGYFVSCDDSFQIAEMKSLSLAVKGKVIKKSYMLNDELADSYRRISSIDSELRNQQFDVQRKRVVERFAMMKPYCVGVKKL